MGKKTVRADRPRRARWIGYVIRGLSVALIAFGLIVVINELSERELSEEAVAGPSEPATLEPVEGTSLVRVTLTSQAAERIDVKTVPVRGARASNGPEQKVVPYGAVIYDAEGRTWVYTNPESLVFVRAPIEVERVDGRNVLLSSGPAVGTEVVSVGTAELFGAEFEVGH